MQNEIHSLLGSGPETRGRLKHAEPTPGPDPAVLNCRSVLALYSADYLRDPQCAREWSVFRERMDRRTRQTGERPDSLIGVLWRADDLVLPHVVASTGQILDDESGQGYQGPGVLGLQRDPLHWDEYRILVRQVAERLTRAANTPLPDLSESESRAVAPRFGPVPPSRDRGVSGAPTRHPDRHDTGQEIVVALVAGTRTRMETLRTSVTAYGESPEEWRPFRPGSDEAAVSVVRRALRACGVDRMTVVPLDSDPPDPDLGTGDQAAVLVLVDAWMTGDVSFRALWERLSRSGAGISAVIVVLTRQDEESRLNARRLREAMARTPARMLGAAHHEVGSPEALAHTVAGVLADTVAHQDGDRTGEEAPWDRTGDLSPESASERLSRRRRERAGWIRRSAGPWPPLFSGASGELWGGG
ncbi:FxsC protein [Streptomyces sp. AK02-01A]|uniref:FxsC protein n=1 Tax=Streptomyces sp. AK02-01A TaxID=3028648 RepID=UPI0029B9E857|nr:FxsC protein [Streptomyces sp. AK02-01A]MDX3850530.1 FxsC protein [Streptomyces sp. AK02-01A]